MKGPRVPGTPQQHQACGDSISKQPPGGRLKLAWGSQETRPGRWAGPWQEAVTGRCVSQTVPSLGQDGCQVQHGLLWQGPRVPEGRVTLGGRPVSGGERRCGSPASGVSHPSQGPGPRQGLSVPLSLCPSPTVRSDRGLQPVFIVRKCRGRLFLELTGPGLNRERGPSPELSIRDSWAVSSLFVGV